MTDRQRLANPVGWFEIYVAEMDRAKDFYADVVGAGFSAAPVAGEGPDAGMEMAFLMSMTARPARATARGSKIYVEKQSIGEMGFIAIVGDSEGNSIGLHSWV